MSCIERRKSLSSFYSAMQQATEQQLRAGNISYPLPPPAIACNAHLPLIEPAGVIVLVATDQLLRGSLNLFLPATQ